MKDNFERCLAEVLKHEGGWADHPKDPGGATNKGITIGTLKRLGIDVDGDGDSDVSDLKALPDHEVARVYRLFYWDAVRADLLPSGLDYAMFDFAVNSGPGRAAKHLQRILGEDQDGDVGPKTLAAVAKADAKALVHSLCDSRLRFVKALDTWQTFGRGWQRRIDDVRAKASQMAAKPEAPAPKPAPHDQAKPSIWAAIISAIAALFGRGK